MRTAVHKTVSKQESHARRWTGPAVQRQLEASTEPLLTLQRAIGNRGTGQLIQLCRDGHI